MENVEIEELGKVEFNLTYFKLFTLKKHLFSFNVLSNELILLRGLYWYSTLLYTCFEDKSVYFPLEVDSVLAIE